MKAIAPSSATKEVPQQHERGSTSHSNRPSVIASSRWVFIGTALAKPMQLLGNVLLAHFLGPVGMGTFGLASSAAVTLSGIVGLGFGDAANKLLAEHYRRDPEMGRAFGATIVWFSFANSCFLFGLLWLFQSYWQNLIFPAEQSRRVLALSLWLSWANILASLSIAIFNGLQQFKSISFLSACQAILSVALTTPFAYFGGAVCSLLGFIVSSLLFVIISAVKLHRIDKDFFRVPSLKIVSISRKILTCSAPFWMSALTIGPLATLSFALLAKQQDGQLELGVFNTANSLKMLIATIPSILGPVLMAAIIEEGGSKGNESAFSLLYRRSLLAVTFLSVPVLVVTSLGSETIFWIYGADYKNAANLFQPLSAAVALGLVGSATQFSLVAKSHTWVAFLIGSFQQILMYGFAIILVPSFLGLGLAWANFLSSLIGTILFFEFGSFLGAVPKVARKMHYGCIGLIALILLLSRTIPDYARQLLMPPVFLLITGGFLYRFRELRIWAVSVMPSNVLSHIRAIQSKTINR